MEVTFSSDRGRFAPFREDLEVAVGAVGQADADEVLAVGVVGRCWMRQMYLVPGNPVDEPFYNTMLPGGAGVQPVDDIFNRHPSAEVRNLDKKTKSILHLAPELEPLVKLEFPDPFGDDIDPASYTDIGSGGGGGGGKPGGAAKGKSSASGSGIASDREMRSQTRSLLVSCAKVEDGRAGSGNGTFEIEPSTEFTESGLFSLSVDKGAVTAGGNVSVDVTCSLPKPRGLGGLSAGSWKEFPITVKMTGGWAPEGEAAVCPVKVVLKCFISF